MKCLLILLFLIPVFGISQKIKINEYDRFLKQRRIEAEPVPILFSPKAKVYLTYIGLGSVAYVQVSGYGWGAAAIDEGQEMVLLFSNDSTVAVKSTALQTFEVISSTFENTYKHNYFIKIPDIRSLSQYDLVGIRKYGLGDYNDLKVSKEDALRIKKSGSLFLEELQKERMIPPLMDINITDISKHVGDSVRFCSRVFSTRFLESSPNKPTFLDMNDSYSSQALTIIIWEQDRKNFYNKPDSLYNQKDVCVSGVVELHNNKHQIVIRRRDQIAIKSDISLSEVDKFGGDSVTVSGKVITSKIISATSNSSTLLNMGAAYPDQQLTLVIDNISRTSFTSPPETYYINKEIRVTGKVEMYQGKPQIIIHNKNQITEVPGREEDAVDQLGQVVNKPKMVEKTASYPGGQEALMEFLKNNLVYPKNLGVGEEKIVIAKFLIKPDGSTSDIRITQPGGKDFDKEVIRVLKKMPKWEPQMANGTSVPVSVTQPITFVRPESGSDKNQ